METQQTEAAAAVVPLAALRESYFMRDVNNRMRGLAETLRRSDRIVFFCECRDATCLSPIQMSAGDFDGVVANQTGWLLREGHDPSEFCEPGEPVAPQQLPELEKRSRSDRRGRDQPGRSETFLVEM